MIDIPAMDLEIIIEAERTCGSKTARLTTLNDDVTMLQVETAEGPFRAQMIAMGEDDDLEWLRDQLTRALAVRKQMRQGREAA